jgi:hypothetical protein
MKWGVCLAISVAACGNTSQDDGTFEVPGGKNAFSGTGSSRSLTQSEFATYASDRQYMRSMAKRGVAMTIDHTDPRQHRFALTRMKIAGKTPANSPQLFKQMERAQYAAPVPEAQKYARVAGDGSLQSQHHMLSTGKTAVAGTAESAALASRKDPLSYGYVDCNVYDGEGNPLGDTSYLEVYGNMPFFSPKCTGDLGYAQDTMLEGDSFLTENLVNGNTLNQSYILSNTVPADANIPTFASTVAAPADINHNGTTLVCLQRADSDCDYFINNSQHLLKLPLQGSITITNAQFVTRLIDTYKTGADTSSQIYVTLTSTHGGGCTLPQFAITDFWNSVTATTTQISWDLNTDTTRWAQFSPDCALVQDRVDLTMDLYLPVTGIGFNSNLEVLLSTVAESGSPYAYYQITPPIRETNSCLAAGTQIATADGKTRNIEDLHVGDTVANPYAASLTVEDTTIGTESTPMVHIVDDHGRELLMTEMHPLYVVDHGIVAAKHLRVGDEVKTIGGSSKLVRISRESYGGKVHNLRVGSATEMRSLGADRTAMYANGFLVGDSQIQAKYQSMDLRTQAATTRLPVSWRSDFQSSASRLPIASSADLPR